MGFFDNRDLLHEYARATKVTAKQSVPDSAYFEKIFNLIEKHFKIGELFMEFIKTGCSEYGNVCTYCDAHPFTGPAMQRIPQPIPDPERPCHFMDVFQMPTVDSEGKQ